jgi:transposase-like protein
MRQRRATYGRSLSAARAEKRPKRPTSEDGHSSRSHRRYMWRGSDPLRRRTKWQWLGRPQRRQDCLPAQWRECRFDRADMNDDETWFERTYPLPEASREVSEEEKARLRDQLCFARLEQICWTGKPVCPKCGKRNAYARRGGARGRGWQCRECGERFYILDAIPGMTSTHQPMSRWFRAMYLLRENPRLIPNDLVRRLGTEWKYAKPMRETIVRLQTENPELIRRVVEGPGNRGKTPGAGRGQAGWPRHRMTSARRGTGGASGTPRRAPR